MTLDESEEEELDPENNEYPAKETAEAETFEPEEVVEIPPIKTDKKKTETRRKLEEILEQKRVYDELDFFEEMEQKKSRKKD